MGAGVRPELDDEDPLTAYRQQRDTADPLTAYRRSKSSIVLPPGEGEPDIAPSPKLKRLRPVVVTKPEERPKPMQAAEADVTKVGPTPDGLAGQLKTHAPGQSGHFGTDVAESAMEMVTHPVATAKALAETPARAGYALGKYTRGQGSGKDAAVGAAQTAAMLIGGPAEKLAEPVVARLVGEAAAPVVTRTALGAATGAVFTPDRPAIGATLGGAAGALSSKGVAAAQRAERYAKFDELSKQHPDWFGESTPAETETRANHLLANPNPATARVVDQPPAAPAEPDFTVDEPNKVPSPIEVKGVFGGALEQHGRDYADGKIAPPVAPPRFTTAADDANLSHVPNGQPGIQIKPVSEDNTNGMVIVSRDQSGVPQGYLTLEDLGDGRYGAHEVYVRTDARRQGLATSLYAAAKEAGAKNIVTGYGGYATDEGESLGKALVGKGVVDQMIPRGSSAPFMNEPAEEAKPEKKEGYDYSSTQMNLPKEAALGIKRLADQIPEEDLAENGRETTPHITVKYGLHGKPLDKVRELLKDEGPVTVKLGKTSIFPAGESGNGDVVKVDIDSPALHRLNKKIADALPHTDTHPEYKPHATVAYVKPGLGKKYEGNDSLAGEEWVLDRLTFSGKDGKTVEIPLKGERKKLGTPAASKPPVHDEARGPTGRLRDNLETVKSDGLIHEMFRLLGAEDQTDQQRAIYRTVDDPNMSRPVTVPTIKGGRNLQAEALHRIELKKGVAGRIEKILNARGMDDQAITRRYAELSEIAAERSAEVEGMDNEESGDTSFDFGKDEYTSEHGEGAGGGEVAAQRADAGAEGAASRSAADAGSREREGTSPAEGEASDLAPKRAQLYHELHNASTPEARAEVMERIKALDEPKPDDEIMSAQRSDRPRPELNGYDQAVHDLWKEQGTHGRLALLDNWRRLYPEQEWFPEWADRDAEDLPAHVREKIGMERVNQAIALNDIMSRLRTGESSVGAQFDKSLFKKLGANLYKGDIPSVIVKEGIQNAFDSIRPLGDKGRIHVDIDPTKRTITIADNGHGMTPEVASNEFMDVGGSSKLEGSSGGFGLAKVGLLASAEHFSLVTIAEVTDKSGFLGRERTHRILTTISGSADDWIAGTLKFKSGDFKDDSQGTGTRLSVTVDESLKPQFYQAESLLQTIMNAHHEAYQLTGTVRQNKYVPGYRDRPSTTGTEDKPVTANHRLELNRDAMIKESVPGADIEAIPSKDQLVAEGPFDIATDVHILNNGLYQFGTFKSLGTGGPKQLIVNIKPTVPVDHPDYPFTTSREDVKGHAVNALAKIYKDMAAAAGATEIRDLIRALNAGIKIGSRGTTSLFDTTYATPRATLEAMAKKPYVSEMADRINDMTEMIAKAIGSRLTFPEFHFGGLSTAHGYLGVNISRSLIAAKARALNIGYEGDTSNTVLLNPWMLFDELSTRAGTPGSPKQLLSDDEFAPALAEQTYGTIVHEISHQLARGHGEDFAGTQTRFDAVAVRVAHVALDVLEDMWRVALKGGVREDVNNLRVEAWGRGKPDNFKKFSGHLRAEPPEGNPGGLPVGGDAASAHLRPSETDGSVGEGDAERRRLGARARGAVRGSETGSEEPRSHSASTSGTQSRNGRQAKPALDRREPDPTAVASTAAGRFDKVKDDVKKMFAPASRGPLARETANITREQVARMAHENEIARDRLKEFGKAFDKMSREDRLEFIDKMENMAPQATEQLSDAADAIRDMLDSARDAVRGLGLGHLENFIENYFPHIWANPDEAARVINQITGKRPMEGTRSFLKRRSIPTIKEGIALGLEPISTNPVDLSLLKIREMNRYIMGQRVMRELKNEGLAEFVHALSKAPDGYVRINDHVAMVYGPPDVPVKEAFDAQVRQKLMDVIKALDPKLFYQRTTAVRGKTWGFASPRPLEQMVTRFGGDATIIMHELGHILDFRYGLWDRLVEPVAKRAATKGKAKTLGKQVPDKSHPSNSAAAVANRTKIREELRALADLRFESKTDKIGPTYKKYVRKKEEQIANAIHARIYAKEKMQRVAPTVYARLEDFLNSDPKLKPLLNVEPSLELESGSARQPVGGLVVKGQYWAPEAAARIINNYLSPGLRGNAVFDSYMGLGNFMNGAQLGFSAFHLGFTSMEAAVSRVALSLRQLAAGKPVKALGSFASAPAAPVTNYLRGRKLYNAYLNRDRSNAEMTQIVDALISGGGRIRMDDFYKTGAIQGFKKALEDHNPWGVAWRAYPAFIELAVKPVLEHVVPRQKMGVFSDLARLEIEKLGENPDPTDVRAAMAKIWDSVDNRMGQLVYDNLFWNKVGKDLAMASVRAVGWNLGTLREIGGGLSEIPGSYKRWKEGDEILTTRMSYIIALPIFVGMMGAIYNYLATGEAPKEAKDYFYPRTGALGPDGNPERVQLPSYMKDVWAYAHHPVHTIESKLHPTIETISEIVHNKDFYGTMIVDPDAPLEEKVKEYGKFMSRSIQPFALRNALVSRQRNQSLATQAQSFIGVTAAPREVVRTPAQNKMAEFLARHAPSARTPEESDKGELHRAVTDAVRKGVELPQSVNDALDSEKLKRGVLIQWIHDARLPSTVQQFKKLTLDEAERVYNLASDDEKALWANAYRTKVVNGQR